MLVCLMGTLNNLLLVCDITKGMNDFFCKFEDTAWQPLAFLHLNRIPLNKKSLRQYTIIMTNISGYWFTRGKDPGIIKKGWLTCQSPYLHTR